MFNTGIDFCVLVCLFLYFVELFIVNCVLYVIFFLLFRFIDEITQDLIHVRQVLFM